MTVVAGLDETCGHAWSPDGKYLVTTVVAEEQDGLRTPCSELLVVDLEGNEIFSSDGLPDNRKCNPSWSPDGKYIYYAARTPQGEYWDPEPVSVLRVADDFAREVVEEGSESRSSGISSTFDDW